MIDYESIDCVWFSTLRRDASWPDIQFCHTWLNIQTDPQPSFKHTSLWCCTQNILWTCHKHDNESLWIRWFGSTQLLFYQVRCLRRDVSWPDIQLCHKWVSIQADPQPSLKHTSHCGCRQNILWTCHEHGNEGYESVGLVPYSSYLVRLDVLGGMRPDQTYIFTTQGKHPAWPSTFLQTHVPLMLHPKYPLDMP